MTAVAAMLGAWLALAPAANAQGKYFYGVVVPGSDSIASSGGSTSLDQLDFELMAGGGVGTIRFKASWRVIEPVPGQYFWRGLDRIIGSASARGIRSLPVVNLPPGHVRVPPTQAADRQAFYRLMSTLAARYGPDGDFWEGPYQAMFPGAAPLPVVSWQLFNEQNASHHWQGMPWPRRYGQLIKAGARGLRSRNPNAEVVLGGMFGTPGGRKPLTSWRFLAKLYRVKRIKQAFDTVGVHPYSGNLRGLRQQVRRIRRVMRRNNHRRGKIRITELSWGAANGGHPQNVGPEGQRRMLKKSFRLFARKRGRKRWNIVGVNWYSWHDGGAACKYCDSSGLFAGPPGNRQPRPAWQAFTRLPR